MSEGSTEWLHEVLQDVQLLQFLAPIRDDLQVTRLEHFDYVKPEDLEKIGLSKPGNNIKLFIFECFNVWRWAIDSEWVISFNSSFSRIVKDETKQFVYVVNLNITMFYII